MRKSFTRLFSLFVLLMGLSFQMAYGIVFDGTKSLPVNGNANVKPSDIATKFVVAFDVAPVISDAGGTAVIYKNGGLFKTYPVTKTSSTVKVVGTTLEITHSITSFTYLENYSIAITNGAVTGLAGGLTQGTYLFTIGDYESPKLLTAAASFTPNKGAVDVMANLDGSAFSLMMTFDEAVNKPASPGAKAVYVYNVDGTVIDIIEVSTLTPAQGLGTAAITVPIATTAIFKENTKYYVLIDQDAFVDVTGNANKFGGLSDKTVWTFTTRDHSAPGVSLKNVEAITTTTATLNVTLAEAGKYYYGIYPAAATPSANDVVTGAGGPVLNGNKVVATAGVNVPSALTGLSGGTAYKAWIVTENKVTVGAPVVGTTAENIPFSTVDNTKPNIISRGALTNSDKKTNALFMTFDEQVKGGTGSLDLRLYSNESYVYQFDASTITSTKITTAADATKYSAPINSWVVVINFTAPLPSYIRHYVVFPATYITDIAGNAYTGGGTEIVPINKGNWDFYSSDFEIPTFTVAFVTPTSLASDITITFNEEVKKQVQSGNWANVITLENANVLEPFTITSPAGFANANTVITINPTAANLTANTDYVVRVRRDAVEDLSGNKITTGDDRTLTTGDLGGFSVQYGSSVGPTSNTNLLAASTIKIKFSKAVTVNTSGTVWEAATVANLTPLLTFKKGATVMDFTVAYSANTITITPTLPLVSFATDYIVTIDGTKIKDSQGTLLTAATGYGGGTKTYDVVDYGKPVVALSHAGNMANNGNPLTITFTDENLAGGLRTSNGNVALPTALPFTEIESRVTFKENNSNGPNLQFTATYTAGGVITITPGAPWVNGKTYYYGIGASVRDAAGTNGNVNNATFGSFTMVGPTAPPSIEALTYTINGSAETPVATKLINITPKTGGGTTVTVTFNWDVRPGPTFGSISLTDGTSTWSVAIPANTPMVSGNKLTVDFPTGANLASKAVCSIILPAFLVEGSTAYTNTPVPTFAQFAAKTILFDSKDIAYPIASAHTPTAGATGVALNTPIKISFSEKVLLGTGNILIKDVGTVVQTIAVNAATVSIDNTLVPPVATITKTGDLPKYGTIYTIEIPVTAFTDEVSLNPLNVAYSGNFTTGTNPPPTVSKFTPPDNSDQVALSPLVMQIEFSEPVVKHTSNVGSRKLWYLIKEVGATRMTIDGAGDLSSTGSTDVVVANDYIENATVGVSGSIASIVTGYTPTANTRYYVLITPGAFYDQSLPTNAEFAGIVTGSVWNFSTYDENSGAVTFTYDKRGDNLVKITSNIVINFTRPIVNGDGSPILDSQIANIFTLTKTGGPGTLGAKAFIGTISADKKTVTVLNSSLVTLGELTESSTYTIALTGAAKYSNGSAIAGASDNFTTGNYGLPTVANSIAAAIADVTKDKAKVVFTCASNTMSITGIQTNLKKLYYMIETGTTVNPAVTADVIKLSTLNQALTGAAQTKGYEFTNLAEEQSYVVYAVVEDEAGSLSAISTLIFVTDDASKPTLVSIPTSVDAAGLITFVFNEPVTAAANCIKIIHAAQMREILTLSLNAIPGEPNKLITSAAFGTWPNTYYVEINKGLIGDVPVVAGDVVNYFDGLFRTDLSITITDNVVPTLTSVQNNASPAVALSTNAASPLAGQGAGATGQAISFAFKMNWSENVQKVAVIPVDAFVVEQETSPGSGTWIPWEVIDPANVVPNTSKVVNITISRSLASMTVYRISLKKEAFEDLAGNDAAAGTMVYYIKTKDNVSPTVVFNPAHLQTNVPAGAATLTMTFNEALQLLNNTVIDKYDLETIVSFKKNGVAAAFSVDINGAKDLITVTPTATLVSDATYTYGFSAQLEDGANNLVPAQTASFSTVGTSPAALLLSWDPVKKSPYAAPWTWLGTSSPVTLTFAGNIFTYDTSFPLNNLPVTAAYLANTALTVKKNSVVVPVADLVFTVIDNKTVSVAPKTNWGSYNVIEVIVNGATLQISEGPTSTVLGTVLGTPFDVSTYQAEDTVDPMVDVAYATAPFVAGYYPAKVGVNGVSPVIAKTEALKMYFDEDVKAGTTTIDIHRWDGVPAKTGILATVAADKRTVTLGDLTGLPTNQEYYAIVHPGAIVDVHDNNWYAGLTDVKTWKFMLKDDAIPQIADFMPNTTNTPVNTNLTINFDRPIVLTNGGFIALYTTAEGGTAVEILRGADNVLNAPITVNGNTVTVDITNLAANTKYYVEVATGTFASFADNTKLQVAKSRADWTFTTEVNAAPTILAGTYVPAMDALGVLLNQNVEMQFNMPVEAGSGNIQIHAADGSIVMNFDVNGPDVLISGDKVTVKHPTLAENKQYYVIVPTSAIRNKTYTPEYFAGVIVPYQWKFTTQLDGTLPTMVAVAPNAIAIANNHPVLVLTLSENVKLTTAGGSLHVTKVGSTTPLLNIPITASMIAGSIVTVTYDAAVTGGLDRNTDYFVTVDANALEDNYTNKFAGIQNPSTWTFKTGDWATNIDPNAALDYKVYPNPFDNFVNIDNASKLSKVVITNIVGQVAKVVDRPANSIQLNELRGGVYFITLHDMDGAVIKTVKIVKK
jgi:hypothetical protein